MPVNYDLITEIGGSELTSEAASMVYTRYALAADLARGRRALEIGCASGVGLGLVSEAADFTVGGDVFLPMLQTARRQYGTRIALAQFSATHLPFRSGSFDLVLFMEATYYVREFDRALDEISRILSADGVVLFVNANPERPDFIRSPHSEHYHSAAEFRQLLEKRGYVVDASAGFQVAPAADQTMSRKLVLAALRVARSIAEALHLVPKTLRGRARIKRLVFGKLRTMPAQLPPDFAPRERLVPLDGKPVRGHKVIYVVGRRSSASAGSRSDARSI